MILESYGILSLIFLKIGIFGFGGGYAMLPLIFQEIQKFGIMTSSEFSTLVAISQITPGPIAVNAATYVGYLYAGALGAVVASIAVALPAFILVVLASTFFEKFDESLSVQGFLFGIRPAVVALMFTAVLFMAESSILKEGIFTAAVFENPVAYFNWVPCLFFLVVAAIYMKFKVNPILVTVVAGVLGAFVIR